MNYEQAIEEIRRLWQEQQRGYTVIQSRHTGEYEIVRSYFWVLAPDPNYEARAYVVNGKLREVSTP